MISKWRLENEGSLPLCYPKSSALLFGDLDDGVNALDRIFLPDGITPIVPPVAAPGNCRISSCPAAIARQIQRRPPRVQLRQEIYKSITPMLYCKINSHHGPERELLPLLCERCESPSAK
jgi:hypothetical protein